MTLKRHSGFTLIELLVCVCIIAVLAALALPAATQVRANADSTRCASNLRQLGVGILAYANDNNGTLPGPLFIGVYPWVWGNDKVALATWIRDYIHIHNHGETWTGKKPEDVFMCPFYSRRIRSDYRGDYSQFPSYMLNGEARMIDDDAYHQPFGSPYMFIPGTDRLVQEPQPMKLSQLAELCDKDGRRGAQFVWAIKDADALDARMHTSPYRGRMPQTMVHGSYRNALFFDFHVGRVDIDNKGL